jgi:hypothetical protein
MIFSLSYQYAGKLIRRPVRCGRIVRAGGA